MRRILRHYKIGWKRVLRAIGCRVPSAIRDDLIILQYERIGALIPVLYLAIATIAAVAASASNNGFDIMYLVVLPGGIAGLGVYRCITWYRRKDQPVDLQKVKRHLRSTTWIALVLGLVGGLWTLDAYYDTPDARKVLAPVFIFMLTFAAVICLNSLPRAAIGVMWSALAVPTIAMILSPDVGIRAMGISLMIVTWLMTGFIIHNFSQMLGSLKLRKKLQQLAGSDSLTGLANRRSFETHFYELSTEKDGQIVLTMIDLDGFKQANDAHGHVAGDAVLVEVAKRLKLICPEDSCVARLGGDEFAILSNCKNDLRYHHDLKDAMRVTLSLPYQWEGHQINISASLGMASYPKDGISLSALLKVADQALYKEKSETRRAS